MRILALILLTFACVACDNQFGLLIPEDPDAIASAPNAVSVECPAYLYRNTTQMRYIPDGTFTMGGAWENDWHKTPEWTAETPAFYMDANQVTVGEFLLFIDMTGYTTDPIQWWGLPTEPFETMKDDPEYYSYPALVAWHDAVAYANWVGKRLPTEIEWEKAARGLYDGARFTWGDAEPTTFPFCFDGKSDPDREWDIDKVNATGKNTAFRTTAFGGGPGLGLQPRACQGAFLINASQFNDYTYLMPVGSYTPNDYGLFDMLGNGDEWCSDDWNTHAYLLQMNGVQPNSTRDDGLIVKVVRGGGNIYRPDWGVHVGQRGYELSHLIAGFRLVLDEQDAVERSWIHCPHPNTLP